MAPSEFTISQVSKICGICQRTVQKLFDKGKLKGFRTPNKKKARRVSRDSLVEYMQANGIPLERLEVDQTFRVLGIALDYIVYHALKNSLDEDAGYRLECVNDPFRAGILLVEFNPDVVLVDFSLSEAVALQIAEVIAQRPTYKPCAIAVTGPDKDPQTPITGFHKVFTTPVNFAQLTHFLAERLDQKLDPDA